ncbi:predicted protein [Nematostella vectensis]|uniref:UBC core domain-containing protein n=1 Tax=Nematostella vectensis TaxID=45351 RepID=A7T4W2_NEMVE|nr:predicted protein [Nematostella vectensis]|eukprot:XP_001621100.1 hypothetical protein NEMVEDRAFT_v1g222366 [Nematostella vectensis]
MPSMNSTATKTEFESSFTLSEQETKTTRMTSSLERSFESNGSRPSSTGSPTFSERLKSARRLVLPQHPGRARLAKSTSDTEKMASNKEDENSSNPKIAQEPADFRTLFREQFILAEYKAVYRNPQSGVYVIPSLKSLQEVIGAMGRHTVVRDRTSSISTTNMTRKSFPDSRPLVKFTSNVFHPQIHENGVFNLEVAFPNWHRGKHCIWQILKYMKSCFYSTDTWGGVNQDAVNVVHSSLEEFKEKARNCALESQKIFDEETESSGKFDMSYV